MKRTPRVCVTRNTPYYTQRIGEQSARRCSLLFSARGEQKSTKDGARERICVLKCIYKVCKATICLDAALRRARNMKSLDILHALGGRKKETYAILRYIRYSISFFFFFFSFTCIGKNFHFFDITSVNIPSFYFHFSFPAHFCFWLILRERIKANVIRCKKKLNMLARYIYISRIDFITITV